MDTPRRASSQRAERDAWPGVDERLVEPEGRIEMLDGELLAVAPSERAHGVANLEIGSVLRFCVADGYQAATDLLTRVDGDSDFATDVCIFPAAPGEDGRRQLEVMAFEIRAHQSLSQLTRKSRKLSRRGVRRVFRVDVLATAAGGVDAGQLERARVFEWRAGDDEGWQELGIDAQIDDPCLRTPVSVRALLDELAAEATVVDALQSRGAPALSAFGDQRYDQGHTAGYDRGRSAGYDEGQWAAAQLALASTLGREPTRAEATALRRWLAAHDLAALFTQLRALDADTTAAWLARLAQASGDNA